MFIAKMHTRYPEFHGAGYYNFLIESDYETLEGKIEDNSHDFGLEKIVETKHKTVEAIVKQYPSKSKLNERYFG